jgi:hypothetical protein
VAEGNFNDVSLGEVYRRLVEDADRNQIALQDIRNNMVSKAENNALLAAQNQRIHTIEANLADKQSEAAHDHAELEANSKARNTEMKTLLEKESVERKAALKEMRDRTQGLEDGNKRRRGEWLLAISVGGIGVVLGLAQQFIGRGMGL